MLAFSLRFKTNGLNKKLTDTMKGIWWNHSIFDILML
jgi:hypothetical protein